MSKRKILDPIYDVFRALAKWYRESVEYNRQQYNAAHEFNTSNDNVLYDNHNSNAFDNDTSSVCGYDYENDCYGINPANGLPMTASGLDICGNNYGTDYMSGSSSPGYIDHFSSNDYMQNM